MHCGEQWSKKLSEEETEAVREYTKNAYKNINAALRGIDKKLYPENAEYAKTLHRILKQTELPKDCVVYRGCSSKVLGANRFLPDSMLVGKTFIEEGFLSTSLSKEDAFEGDVLLEIEAPKGSQGIYVGYTGALGHNEREVLFDVGQVMTILDVYRDEKGRRILRVAML